MTGHALMVLGALVIDRLFGYPDWLHRAIGHPVSWIGKLIAVLDGRLNKEGATDRRLRGAIALAMVAAAVLLVACGIARIAEMLPGGFVIEVILSASLLAQKSLSDHVRAVVDALDRGIEEGRSAVAMIVGRDTNALDESGVAIAAIESLAESTSDGVIAPLFWLLIAGLPGIAVYKAINTADSMIGHMSPRYRDFGWAAARLDDLVNLVPARLTGFLIALAALIVLGKPAGRNAITVMQRDAKKHRSPNAGFPEAAMAGALGCRLGGHRAYRGRMVDLAILGAGAIAPSRNDIARALIVYRGVLNVALVLVVALAAASM